MKYRNLDFGDLYSYRKDIYKAYKDNNFITDMQNPYAIQDEQDIVDYLASYIEAKDSLLVGIFDNAECFCYGYILFDNIRMLDSCTAEVHIAIAKEIWGRVVKNLFNEILDNCLFDVLYAMIPQIAVRAIAMAKKMGFKKTGYIPKALPYTNSRGEAKLYDLNIFVYQKGITDAEIS